MTWRARLLAAGVTGGDRVAVLLPHPLEWLIIVFAASKVGTITVGMSTFSLRREIARSVEPERPVLERSQH